MIAVKVMFSIMLLLCVRSAFAQDSDADVIKPTSKHVLITRAAVAAAGGFPYKITQPGYYALDTNLVAPLDTAAILIQSSDVVGDLGGFNVKCSASQATIFLACITDGGGGYNNITIKNGTVTLTASSPTNFGDQVTGLNLESSQGGAVENMNFDSQNLVNYSANAIISATYSIVRNNTFVNAGPTFSCPSLVEGNVNQTPTAGSVNSGCAYINNVGLFPN